MDVIVKFFILGYFFALIPPSNPKNLNFLKNEIIPRDIIILHMSTKNHDNICTVSMDGQTAGWTEKMTYRSGCPT